MDQFVFVVLFEPSFEPSSSRVRAEGRAPLAAMAAAAAVTFDHDAARNVYSRMMISCAGQV